jgi:hypothetical protein
MYGGGYPKKRQWGADHLHIHTEWILYIDADEVVPEKLWKEIALALNDPHNGDKNAYIITKGFHFMGRRFRFGGFSHNAVLLFRKGYARFENIVNESNALQDMEVHERLIVNGKVGYLKHHIIHEDFKGLDAYIDRHNKYSSWEAAVRFEYMNNGRYGHEIIRAKLFGNTQERRRFLKKIAVRMPFEPFLWFLYHYVLRLGVLEGKRGLIASQIRASYIAQVRAKLFEMHLNHKTEWFSTGKFALVTEN